MTAMHEVVTLTRLSRSELEKRTDSLAKHFGMSRKTAFESMAKGTLPKTVKATELKLVFHLLSGIDS